MQPGLDNPADHELDPADIRISGYPDQIRISGGVGGRGGHRRWRRGGTLGRRFNPLAPLAPFRTSFRLRWDEWNNGLQAAGYCLDPEFWGHQQWKCAEVMTGMRATCNKLLSPEKAALAMAQLMKFLRKKCIFAAETAWEEAKVMPSVDWWLAWGAEFPERFSRSP